MRGRLETGKRSKPISLPCRKKKRVLESKEKGAPVRVQWLQIGFRRPGFTPPPSTSTVHRRLRRRNRDKPWFYPQFFRRLRGRASGRGDAARYSLFTLHYSLLLFFVGRDDPGAPNHAAESGRGGYHPPATPPLSTKQSGRCRWQRPLGVSYLIDPSLPGESAGPATTMGAIPKFFLILFLTRKRISTGRSRRGPCRPG